MAKLFSFVEQHRHQLVIPCFKVVIGIDVEDFDRETEFCSQGRERRLHIVTKMTIVSRHQRQSPHLRGIPASMYGWN